MILPTAKLLGKLERLQKLDDFVDQFLSCMGANHMHVSYEKLFHAEDTHEWMQIFQFLERGPGTGLTREQLNNATNLGAAHQSSHQATLANFKAVQQLLTGTEFEKLIH
jgi:hypothetical protein